MRYPLKSILRRFLQAFDYKRYIIPTLVILSCISCSYAFNFKKILPKKIKYSEIEFVNCNSPNNMQYLCISKENAEMSVLDLKKCQEQNILLRELIDGN
jgi:hypothetical protein